MKKCPFCKAEIEENARFCLYCMTSLEEKEIIAISKEKKKRWLVVLATILLFVIGVLSIYIALRKDSPNVNSDEISSESQTLSETDSNTSIIDTTQVPDDSQKNNDFIEETVTQPNYSYIEGTMENVYPTGYGTVHAPEDVIVITKVNYKEESGNYVIPDTIDGKRVGAIMPFAFCDASISPTVRSVTLPQTVKTIWSNAFQDCYNLTDIYMKSGTIGIYTDAFPETTKRTGTLTIHCAKDCKNFDFYSYSNISYFYDAEYEEWNDENYD